MSTHPDILDYIRVALNDGKEPLTPARVEQTLDQARRTFGGETVYVRSPERHVTRRTIQNRRARAR